MTESIHFVFFINWKEDSPTGIHPRRRVILGVFRYKTEFSVFAGFCCLKVDFIKSLFLSILQLESGIF